MALNAVLASLVVAAIGAPRVDIPGLGTVEGVTERVRGMDVDAFRGIKYGEQVRFGTSTPVAPWSGVKEAKSFGPTCYNAFRGSCPENESEDCLFLNVFRQKGVAGPKPVVVHIHGGSFRRGCSNNMPGQVLAAHRAGAVVVTLNYRLHALGFLGSDKLRGPNGETGNWGFGDQRLALEWVKRHIHAFGGDTNQITVLGHSAGSGCLTGHLVSPGSKGLFQRAILSSGLGGTFSSNELSTAEMWTTRMMDRLGCADIACLRAANASAITGAVEKLVRVIPSRSIWAPVVDGVNLQASSMRLIADGKFHKDVAIMAGETTDEFAVFIDDFPAVDQRTFLGALLPYVASQADLPTVLQLYSQGYSYPPAAATTKNDLWWAANRALSDAVFVCPALFAMRKFAEGSELNHYRYTLPHVTKSTTYAPGTGPDAFYVAHSAPLLYFTNCANYPVRGASDSCDFEVPSDQTLAARASDMILRFVFGHQPTLRWKPFAPTGKNTFVLDNSRCDGGTGNSNRMIRPDVERCAFWDRMRPDSPIYSV